MEMSGPLGLVVSLITIIATVVSVTRAAGRLETQIALLRQAVEDMARLNTRQLDDHETRLRRLEERVLLGGKQL